MDTSLKQRLIGAAVLVALAVIFLPMLVQGPAPDSGASDVPLSMPATPDTGMETRELPLTGPGDMPSGGATGMPNGGDAAADDAAQSFPAATAGGGYAVHFGSYASADAAQSVVRALQKARLPGYSEAVQLDGKPAWRVRIGPFASQADAEAARLGASQVRQDVNARVVVLDADTAPAATAPIADAAKPVATPLPPEPKPAAPQPAPAKPPATAKVEPPKPQPAPATPPPAAKPAPAPAAANVGFAVQLAAFSNPADANALRDRARAAGFDAFTESVRTDKGTLTRVRIGPVADRAEADQLKAQAQAKLGVAGIVRPHP
jgi:cell division septation protein DedD